jgi:hypothetical protein
VYGITEEDDLCKMDDADIYFYRLVLFLHSPSRDLHQSRSVLSGQRYSRTLRQERSWNITLACYSMPWRVGS